MLAINRGREKSYIIVVDELPRVFTSLNAFVSTQYSRVQLREKCAVSTQYSRFQLREKRTVKTMNCAQYC